MVGGSDSVSATISSHSALDSTPLSMNAPGTYSTSSRVSCGALPKATASAAEAKIGSCASTCPASRAQTVKRPVPGSALGSGSGERDEGACHSALPTTLSVVDICKRLYYP